MSTHIHTVLSFPKTIGLLFLSSLLLWLFIAPTTLANEDRLILEENCSIVLLADNNGVAQTQVAATCLTGENIDYYRGADSVCGGSGVTDDSLSGMLRDASNTGTVSVTSGSYSAYSFLNNWDPNSVTYTAIPASEVVLTGSGASDNTYVFTFDASMLTTAGRVRIDVPNDDDTVIINVTGLTATMGNNFGPGGGAPNNYSNNGIVSTIADMAMAQANWTAVTAAGGLTDPTSPHALAPIFTPHDAGKIMWNFPEATSVRFAEWNSNFYGSLLAPCAGLNQLTDVPTDGLQVKMTGYQQFGQSVAASDNNWTATITPIEFNGCLPINPLPPTEVPPTEVPPTEVPLTFDYGDDPNHWGTSGGDAPRHTLGTDLWLGTAPDAESNGQPDMVPNGSNGDGDDEDGVIMPELVSGQPTEIKVNALNDTGEPAYVVGYVDINGDWDWDDEGEVFTATVPATGNLESITMVFGATNEVAYSYPIYTRFRISSDLDSISTPMAGTAPDGEVEDYVFTLEPLAIDLSGLDIDQQVSPAVTIAVIISSSLVATIWYIRRRQTND